MTLMQILILIIAIIVYIIIIFYLTYKFGDEAPSWFQFIAFPVDVIGFILLFPIAMIQRFKLNTEYKSLIRKNTKNIDNE